MTITRLHGGELRDAVRIFREIVGNCEPLCLRRSAFKPPASMVYIPGTLPVRNGSRLDEVARLLCEYGDGAHCVAIAPTLLRRKVQTSSSKLFGAQETVVLDSETVFMVDNDPNSVTSFLTDVITHAGIVWVGSSRRFAILADEVSLYYSVAGDRQFIQRLAGQKINDIEKNWTKTVGEIVGADSYYSYLTDLSSWHL